MTLAWLGFRVLGFRVEHSIFLHLHGLRVTLFLGLRISFLKFTAASAARYTLIRAPCDQEPCSPYSKPPPREALSRCSALLCLERLRFWGLAPFSALVLLDLLVPKLKETEPKKPWACAVCLTKVQFHDGFRGL